MTIDWTDEGTEQDQGSEAWHQFRRHHIGASEIGIILGESDFRSVWELWAEKCGMIEGQETNFAMQRGKLAEPLIATLYESETGERLESKVCEYADWPVLSASLDGVTESGKVVEFKYPGKEDLALAQQGVVPEKYRAQVQQQMMCAGSQEADFVVYDGEKIWIVPVKRDADYCARILVHAKEFWKSVETRTEPETDELHIIDAAVEELLLRRESLKEQIDALSKQFDAIDDSLRGYAKKAKNRCGEYELVWTDRKGAIDYSKIDVLKTLDLEQYRKAPTRAFQVKRSKLKWRDPQ